MAGTSWIIRVLATALVPLVGCAGPALVARDGASGLAATPRAAHAPDATGTVTSGAVTAPGVATVAPGAPSAAAGPLHERNAAPGTSLAPTSESASPAGGSRALADLIAAAELAPEVKTRLLAALALDAAAVAPAARQAERHGASSIDRRPEPHIEEGLAVGEHPQATDPGTGHMGECLAGAAPPSAAIPLETQTQPSGDVVHVAAGATEGGHAPAGTAASTGARLDWEEALAGAVARLESAVGKESAAEDVLLALRLRLLYLAAGKREDALRPVAGLTPVEQEFWNNELYALTELIGPRSDAAQRAAIALPHHRYAALALAEMAPLRVQNLAFCREVASFGMYTRYAQDRFQPGEEVLLYAELENFHSRSTARGWHTSFRARYQIFDASGRRVAHGDLPRTEEYCAHPRRDYFVCYFVTIPAKIYDGQYTLELSIEDVLQNELASATIEFTVDERAAKP